MSIPWPRWSRSTTAERPLNELDGVKSIHPGRREMHRTPRVGARHDVGRTSLDGPELSVTDLARHLGFDNRVGAAGPTAQALVIQFDEFPNDRAQNRAGRLVRPLDVTQVARVLNRDTQVERSTLRKLVDPGGDELADVEDSFREHLGLGSTEKAPVLFERGTASGRVDDDGAAVVECADHLLGHRPGVATEAGMGVERSAARSGVPCRLRADSDGIENIERRLVDLALHGVHHAAGEDVNVIARRGELFLSKRESTPEAEALGQQPCSLGDREEARPDAEKPRVA